MDNQSSASKDQAHDQAHDQAKDRIRGASVLIVGEHPSDRENLADYFAGLECDLKMAENPILALDELAKNVSPGAPDVLVLAAPSSLSEVLPLVDKVAHQDGNRPAVFVVSKQIETDADIDEAFFRGVDAVFFQPLTSDDFLRGIGFCLDVSEESDHREHRRLRIRRAKIEFLNESTGLRSSGYLLNISRGGMFVCSMYNQPEKFQSLLFRIRVVGGEAPKEGRDQADASSVANQREIVGRGVVRWVRAESKFGRPAGFGVQFKELDSCAREEIDSLMAPGF